MPAVSFDFFASQLPGRFEWDPKLTHWLVRRDVLGLAIQLNANPIRLLDRDRQFLGISNGSSLTLVKRVFAVQEYGAVVGVRHLDASGFNHGDGKGGLP